MDNEQWAQCIVETLVRLGADYFVCAPGSRSTPLLLAVASNKKARSLVHFDERGLGFHAVGYAKASGKPAVIVVTSGTAVGNLLPAVMEANADHLPLILLTADRPPELRDCGANQTCDQVKLFETQVRWQVDLPCPDSQLGNRYLTSTIAQAITSATVGMPGPVHVNCMFREPLIGNKGNCQISSSAVSGFTAGELHLNEETLNTWAEHLNQHAQGLILIGSEAECISEEVFALADKLQWPLVADILSPTRSYQEHPLLISYADLILKIKPTLTVDTVIQFGERLVSKTVSEWLKTQEIAFYLQVTRYTRRQDPYHLVTHRLQSSSRSFIREMLTRLSCKRASEEVKQWTRDNTLCKETVTDFFSESKELTEPGIVWQLQPLLTQGWALFLANSMPIRDANQFLPPTPSSGSFFGNRGVSGIDGNIATATGIVEGSQTKTIALLGDLSFLHDLNSLSLISQVNHPLVICVINNQGGGIFSFLPIAQQEAHFEKFFAAAHPWDLSAAADLFKIPYFHPTTQEGFEELLCTLNKRPRSCLIEIKTQRQENVDVHREILDRVKRCLNAAALQEEIPLTLT